MENRQQQDRDKALVTDPKQINSAPENVKLIEWEDFDQELARLWSLTSALTEANEKKRGLREKLQSFVHVRIFLIQIWLLFSSHVIMYIVFSKSVLVFCL